MGRAIEAPDGPRGLPAMKARPRRCCAHLEAILRACVPCERSRVRNLSSEKSPALGHCLSLTLASLSPAHVAARHSFVRAHADERTCVFVTSCRRWPAPPSLGGGARDGVSVLAAEAASKHRVDCGHTTCPWPAHGLGFCRARPLAATLPNHELRTETLFPRLRISTSSLVPLVPRRPDNKKPPSIRPS